MKTELLNTSPQDLKRAGEILRAGGLVAFPTETVYGLGADARAEDAVRGIFRAKGRPADNPLIVHILDPEQMKDICSAVPQAAWNLAEAFWPGPLTMVLPKRDCIPMVTSGGLDTVGVRCPSLPAAREILRCAGVPVAAPSANRSGKPSPTEFLHIMRDLMGRVDALVDGGRCPIGVESTVVDLTATPPRLLRPGDVTLTQLRSVLGDVAVDDAIRGEIDPDRPVRAPGMKYRHYAPAAPVVILRGPVERAVDYVNKSLSDGQRGAVLCFEEEVPCFAPRLTLSYGSRENPLELEQNVFSALRELDEWELTVIYARCPEGDDRTLSVENRLKKAAGFQVVDV